MAAQLVRKRRFAGTVVGNDCVEPEPLEIERQRGMCGLGSVAMAPVLEGEPPADLDHRCERDVERYVLQADEASKVSGAGCLHRPETVAVLGEMRPNPAATLSLSAGVRRAGIWAMTHASALRRMIHVLPRTQDQDAA